MITYKQLWETMKKKGVTTQMIDDLCRILDCRVEDIIKYEPSDES